MTYASKPPTPSPQNPASRSDWRFEPLNIQAEWIESYRPGGLHPLHPGDWLDGDRYTIVCKLGYGSFSTVWLAQDNRRRRLVAIKVARADARTVLEELRLYEVLARSNRSAGTMQHVVMPADQFRQTGPNGEHQCLVFEPMGPSASKVLEGIPWASSEAPSQQSAGSSDEPVSLAPPSPSAPHLSSPSEEPSPPPPTGSRPGASLTLRQRKALLKQLLLGLHCLHTSEIAHGDINPGNLLLSIQPLGSKDAHAIRRSCESSGRSAPVRKIDGKQDAWAPRHLYVGQPLTDWVDFHQILRAKISDLGAGLAFTFDNPPSAEECVTPAALRAPEIILKAQIDYTIDIWSFGCIVYEFLTGRSLFQVSGLADVRQEEDDDDHLLQMIDALGQLTPEMFSRWPRRRRYFDENLQPVRSDVGPSEADGELVHGPSLEEAFTESAPDGMGAEESTHVLSLLRTILRYEPSLRPSTSELLDDEWFQSIE